MRKISNYFVSNKTNIYIFLFYLIVPFLFYYNFLFSHGFWAPGDGMDSYMPNRKFLIDSLFDFKFPLWNSNINSGAPFLEDIQNSVFYLPNILIYLLLPFQNAFNYILLFHLSLAGFFTYLYLNQCKIEKKAAILGGIVFMFCAALNARRGHVTIENAIVWVPLILFYYEKLIETKNKKYILFMSIAYALQIFAGFIQISFYTGIALIIYFVFSITRYEKTSKWLIDKINFSIFTIGISAIQIIPTFLLGKYVGRDSITYEVFSSYSPSFKHLGTLIYPYLYGSDSPTSLFKIPNLSPDGVIEFTFYIGILPILFFLYAMSQFHKSFSQ